MWNDDEIGSRPPTATACARSSCAPATSQAWPTFGACLVQNRADGLAGLDQALREPAVAGPRSEGPICPTSPPPSRNCSSGRRSLTASMYSHFAGHWCEPGVEMAHAIQRVVGEPTPSIRQFPWALAYALSPFVTVFREMVELDCLRQRPLRLDNATLVALLGAEPPYAHRCGLPCHFAWIRLPAR
jgi:hypothetical protein